MPDKTRALPNGPGQATPATNNIDFQQERRIINTRKEIAQEHHRSFPKPHVAKRETNASWRTTVDDRD